MVIKNKVFAGVEAVNLLPRVGLMSCDAVRKVHERWSMIVECGGRTYEVVLGSDVDRDALYLEMRDISEDQAGPVVLYGESTAGGELHMRLGFLEAVGATLGGDEPSFLPLALVNEFIGWMNDKLSS